TREACARRAAAVLLQRRLVARIACVLEVEPAFPGQRGAGPSEPGRQHAVEHVDPPLDYLEHAVRVADSHEVAGVTRRQQLSRPTDGLEHQVAVLADREPAERIAVEVERRDLVDGAGAQLDVGAALGDPEQELAGRPLRRPLARSPEGRQAYGFL